MRVTVRLFAALRERAATGRLELELPAGAQAGDVWQALAERLGERPPGLLLAVNREYADPDRLLADGDEVALLPPVSGGGSSHHVELVSGPIDLAAVLAAAGDEEAGATASFIGTVRASSRGRSVRYLEYEAYDEMAVAVLGGLAQELTERHGLCRVAITHRLGRVEIGEASVAIAVSAPQRKAALAACREAIDRLKETVPLWKKEVYEDGESWLGRGS